MNPLQEVRKLLTDLRHDHTELQEAQKALKAEQERVAHHHPLPRTGIDYAFPPHPPADKLHAAGFSFVGRYLTDPARSGKELSFAEAHSLSHNGIDIFTIFEEAGGRAAEGYDAGRHDAQKALHALNQLHPKGEPPIYFACDFDAHGEGKTNDVLEYIRGAVQYIGWHRVGLYAGYDVLLAAVKEHRCKYLWQTTAWSHGQWLPEAQLRQLWSVRFFGADCDIDKAYAADFGQFHV